MKYRLKKDLPTMKAGEIFSDGLFFSELIHDSGEGFTKDEISNFDEWFEPIDEEEKLPERWHDLETIQGYYVTTNNLTTYTNSNVNGYNINIFATENQARSSFAMAKLSQLMKAYNGDWKPDWDDNDQTKYTIFCEKNRIITGSTYHMCEFLAFETKEKRKHFLEHHKNLIEQYFLVYK